MDWNQLLGDVIDAGTTIYDDATFSQQEQIEAQLRADELQLGREALAVEQQRIAASSSGGLDTTTLLMIGGAVLAVVVLMK